MFAKLHNHQERGAASALRGWKGERALPSYERDEILRLPYVYLVC